MAEVSLKNVYKQFGKLEVIHGISCDIHDGEFIVLLGPSGCGKSTMLRMIAGLERITQGEIFIGGKLVNNLEPMDRDIAMVFQNYALYPHMSVYKNMAYGLKIRRMAKAEIERRVQEAANMLGLSNLLDRKPRQLSGGQRQRVAMGRCIVREPQVFLFDEPLSNLDAKLRVQMRLELRNLHEKLGITSIYVTHDQVEAMTLGDRMIIMSNGYAEQIGTPLEVYERPASKFVADFIGSPSMNFFPSRVSNDGQKAELPGTTGFLLPRNGIPSQKGQEVILGIRPEHFELADGRSPTVKLRVSHVETLGADTLVYGYLGETEQFVTVRLADIHRLQKDTVLPLVAPPEKLHVFAKESEKRLEA
ncbi:sn-glycerol-3-phosphate ABC transporter ATP-binding protein UgpC [candidate division KSB3 bacterium]|uniref:Sn-glycerol-3-phosphate ABC transporter ATP-binding protein UgpC n=1 Tax=candidate division KSB3 bacterium TaxID=2044937 RepID=A0A9D5JT77_9BACT|nr:sn-glycerol-3-phosphate ABC transporter ATP-binding protein UgpC [candidate division KSB3 bacterium]MBD3323644.1 sn-glycerol-3-phosphate ABC transporter ATP-binding protein UgpC [candidate division KSB3 bacterium]